MVTMNCFLPRQRQSSSSPISPLDMLQASVMAIDQLVWALLSEQDPCCSTGACEEGWAIKAAAAVPDLLATQGRPVAGQARAGLALAECSHNASSRPRDTEECLLQP